jgi:hypothetical protein
MKNAILVLLSVLAFGCTVNVDEPCPEPEAPKCTPVQTCMARTDGYIWAGLSGGEVGECAFYRYVCVANGEVAHETCEQRWETVCAPGDVDANYGERGE